MRLVRVTEPTGSRLQRRAERAAERNAELSPERAAPPTLHVMPRTCPDCGIEMLRIRLDEHRVEYCSMCQGVWLERELARDLVRRSFAQWHPSNTASDELPEHPAPLRLVPRSEAG